MLASRNVAREFIASEEEITSLCDWCRPFWAIYYHTKFLPAVEIIIANYCNADS